jgi:hypothetical protein
MESNGMVDCPLPSATGKPRLGQLSRFNPISFMQQKFLPVFTMVASHAVPELSPHLIVRVQARLRKEAGSIRNLQQNLIPRIKNLPEMHRWLHIEHKAYNVADQGAFGEDPAKNKDPAIASY